jgi:hypothetical protein
MSAVSASSAAVEEAQFLPVVSASTGLTEPRREGKDDNEVAAAAAVDDTVSRVTPVQEGSDRMMDSGPETPDRLDEGVVLNEQGAGSTAAADCDVGRISLLNGPSVDTLRARMQLPALLCSLLSPSSSLVVSA